jgi:hypothetical protein
MKEWLQSQNWSDELWVAVWVAAVVLISVLVWGYGNYIKH